MSAAEVLSGARRWWVEQADVLDGLALLPDESVNCVVTSPPYWGLRDYGVAGQIGLEATPVEFVASLGRVFAEVRRVLRKDGTCWVNLGDSYAGSWGAQSRPGYSDDSSGLQGGSTLSARQIEAHPKTTLTGSLKRTPGLKSKDLIGIPWRVAFALQDAGWYLRSDIVWAKPNPMPESVTDRPTRSHEYLFLLTKSARYFYDAESVKEPCQSGDSDIKKMVESLPRIGGKHKDLSDPLQKASAATNIGRKRSVGDPSGRNRRSVWLIATEPYPGSHFATFPTALVEPCILAGCPKDGVVLDPFSGAGTTSMVALRHDRRAIGIELSPAYCEMSRARIVADAPMWNREPQEWTA